MQCETDITNIGTNTTIQNPAERTTLKPPMRPHKVELCVARFVVRGLSQGKDPFCSGEMYIS